MDLVHSWGVELAVYLQTQHSGYQDVFNVASTVADLHTTFFFFFPIWFHLRRDTALRLIWVAVLGDWLNLVLKWYGGGPAGTGGRPGDERVSVLIALVSPWQGSVWGEAVLVGSGDPLLRSRTETGSAAVPHHLRDRTRYSSEQSELSPGARVVQGTTNPEA